MNEPGLQTDHWEGKVPIQVFPPPHLQGEEMVVLRHVPNEMGNGVIDGHREMVEMYGANYTLNSIPENVMGIMT